MQMYLVRRGALFCSLLVVILVVVGGGGGICRANEVTQSNQDDLGWLADYNNNVNHLGSSRQSSEDGTSSSTGAQQSLAPYKQPSSWIVGILKEFFDDIDWKTIEDAREQIEKFIRKVDRLVGSVRSIISRAAPNLQQRQELRQSTSDRAAAAAAATTTTAGKSTIGRWWSGGNKDSSEAGAADLTSVKGMLERVACFVGYVRLMNLSNEALAELDASKVVSNLFNSVNRRNSSSWSWFG